MKAWNKRWVWSFPIRTLLKRKVCCIAKLICRVLGSKYSASISFWIKVVKRKLSHTKLAIARVGCLRKRRWLSHVHMASSVYYFSGIWNYLIKFSLHLAHFLLYHHIIISFCYIEVDFIDISSSFSQFSLRSASGWCSCLEWVLIIDHFTWAWPDVHWESVVSLRR